MRWRTHTATQRSWRPRGRSSRGTSTARSRRSCCGTRAPWRGCTPTSAAWSATWRSPLRYSAMPTSPRSSSLAA
eukprot:scaffold190023_cov45-Prasinocladus_malaysianus.AAC.1